MLHRVSTQIAIRLPDELVGFIDEVVASGAARSRAALIRSALERERRRLAAERDAEILQRLGPEDELDDLVAWTTRNFAMDDDA